jgi:preprotein translocase SecE subunit
MIEKIRTFFTDVQFEFQKISWPTYEELKGSTWIVLGMSGVLALILFVMDKIMSTLILDIIMGQ